VKSHPRIRKTAKWGSTVLMALLIVSWIGSAWLHFSWRWQDESGFAISQGRVDTWGPANSTDWPQSPGPYLAQSGKARQGLRFDWKARWSSGFSVPLWFPVLLGAGMTCLAWRLDSLARRRERAGLCPKCYYDRKGLPPDTVCPECGATAFENASPDGCG